MLILGIESSCDDTSVALLNCSEKGCFVVSEKTASQIALHKKYGGVVPEIAGRAHAEKIVPLIEEVLKEKRPDAIAVTAGPGLITGLLVGVEAARALSYAWKIPLVAINHIEGHIYSVVILLFVNEVNHLIQDLKSRTGMPKQVRHDKTIKFPAIALIASGGHTELILMADHGKYKLLGATRDDAAGECFDKVAKLLGLPYPGGPEISRLAADGNPKAIKFPRPMVDSDNYDFSFAGLKTAALYWLRDNKKFSSKNFCAGFEQAIVDVLVAKTIRAARQYKPKTIILAGGVSANKKLRETLGKEIARQLPPAGYKLPATSYSMDNAAMIAVAGYYRAKKKNFIDWKKIKADPNNVIARPERPKQSQG